MCRSSILKCSYRKWRLSGGRSRQPHILVVFFFATGKNVLHRPPSVSAGSSSTVLLLGSAAVLRSMPLAPQSEAAVWLLSRMVCSLAVVNRPEMRVGYPASPAWATERHREVKSMLR